MSKHGTFVSVWDSGLEVETSCEVNMESGEIIDIESVDHDEENMQILICEHVFIDNEEFEVCDECHEYILQTKMVPDEFKGLQEKKICPYCGE